MTAAIELAPLSKTGLSLANPVMTAAGCFGLDATYGGLADTGALGAVVVGPFTARPRRGTAPPRALTVPGGVLLHTGLANPGITASTRDYSRAWHRSVTPVIAHVAATDVRGTAACCECLEGTQGIVGVELGLADTASIDVVADLVDAARSHCSLPLIVRLPLCRASEICNVPVDCGADALTVAAPPRGSATDPGSGRCVTARLYGRFVHPLALQSLRAVLERVTVPVIACGGVYSVENALDFLAVGAIAVQVDAAIWRSPWSVSEIARGVATVLASGELARHAS